MDKSSGRSSAASSLEQVLLLEPFWLALLGLPLLFPGRFLPIEWQAIFIPALFLFWPIRWYSIVQPRAQAQGSAPWQLIFLNAPQSLSVVLLLCWTPVALWASVSPLESLAATGYFVYGICLWVMFTNCPPLRARPDVVTALLLGGTLLLALLAPFITDWKTQMRIFRLPIYTWLESLPFRPTDMIHANVLAGALVIALPISLALAIRPPEPQNGSALPPRYWLARVPHVWFGVLSAIFVIVLILTQSRSAYVATSISLSIVVGWRLGAVRIVLLIWALALPLFIGRVGPTAFFAERGSDAVLGGWSGRLEVWMKSVSAIRDFPLTGIGIGTFEQIMPLLYPLRVRVEDFPHAHNLFLQIALDLGLPGLIAWLATMIGAFALGGWTQRTEKRTLKMAELSVSSDQDTSSEQRVSSARWRLPTQFSSALSFGVLTSLMAFFIHGLLDVVLWGNKLAFLPWFLLAIIVNQYQARDQKQQSL